jgi:hypothetical protein
MSGEVESIRQSVGGTMDTDTTPWFKSPMEDLVDDPDYRPIFRYRPWYSTAVILFFVFAFAAMIVLNPPAPTYEMLAEIDKSILLECKSNGLRCSTSETDDFSDHAKLNIRWFPDNEYHVSSIRLKAASPREHLRLLSQLPELTVVMIPYARQDEIARLKSDYPNLEFNRNSY